MALISVWVDRSHSKIFKFTSEGVTHQELKTHEHDHHTHVLNQSDHQHSETKMFKQIIPAISEASELVILGPGIARHHFQNFLVEHHPAIGKKIRACETAENLKDNELIELARKYFTTEKLS